MFHDCRVLYYLDRPTHSVDDGAMEGHEIGNKVASLIDRVRNRSCRGLRRQSGGRKRAGGELEGNLLSFWFSALNRTYNLYGLGIHYVQAEGGEPGTTACVAYTNPV